MEQAISDTKKQGKELKDEEIARYALEIRRLVLRMVHEAACGHPGGPLGLADIFAVLYFDILCHRPEEPNWIGRDRLLLSNGHVSAVRYAAMKLAGYFPDLDILSFRKFGSPFQGHPSTRYLPELENSSGSLGQGLSAAVGLALGLRLQKHRGRVFVSLSDGECGEGMTWEAAASAVHYKASLIAFIDNNGIQIDGKIKEVCDLRDLAKKFKAFGWDVEKVDGHNIPAIRRAFHEARKKSLKEAGPKMIVFHTTLGKGVSFMQDDHKWHGTAPNREEAQRALTELGTSLES